MRINLNNEWKYSEKYNVEMTNINYDFSDAEDIRIPHTVKTHDFNYFSEKEYQLKSVYQRKIYINSKHKSKVFLLTFEAVAHYAEVCINGVKVRENKCGYHSFTIDITDYVRYDDVNILTVVVDSNENLNQPPFGRVIDYMTYGGIYRDVYLDIKNIDYIKDVFIHTENELTDTVKVIAEIDSSNESANYIYEVFKNNELILKTDNDIEFKNFELWQLEDPQLYLLKVSMYVDNILTDTYESNFGIRKIEFRNNGFYLNGTKVKLRGLNRHQSYPYLGYAMVERGQRLDARILKNELALNAVRCSHYPQSRYFIDECDKLGLLVFIEAPGWQHIGDQNWQDQGVINVGEMVKQYRNHPSIFIWGVRINESEDNHDFYSRTNEIARSLDNTRVTGGVRCIKNSELLEDVYTYNDFVFKGDNVAVENKAAIFKENKPYFISEYNGHMYPVKTFDPERIRSEHALRHAGVINEINKHNDILGGFGWCMFDYNTHKDFGSGDRICYHGVMDMFRNPKMAADVYTSQGAEPYLSVSSNMDIGEYPGASRSDIYAFTNLDSVRLYKNDVFIKEFFPEDSKFKYMKHPPILIDDLIGNLIEDGEKIDHNTSEMIKGLMNDTVRYGFEKISLRRKLDAAYLVVIKHLSAEYITSLFNKYVNNWGSEVTRFRFDGIKNDEIIKSVYKEAGSCKKLEIKCDSTELKEDISYDIATFRLRMLDENENLLSFNNDVVKIEVKGPVEIVGPDVFALRGGSGGFYIKTVSKGEAVVTIKVNEEIIKYNLNIQ